MECFNIQRKSTISFSTFCIFSNIQLNTQKRIQKHNIASPLTPLLSIVRSNKYLTTHYWKTLLFGKSNKPQPIIISCNIQIICTKFLIILQFCS